MDFIQAWYGGLAGSILCGMVILIVQLHRLTSMLRKIYLAGILTGKIE